MAILICLRPHQEGIRDRLRGVPESGYRFRRGRVLLDGRNISVHIGGGVLQLITMQSPGPSLLPAMACETDRDVELSLGKVLAVFVEMCRQRDGPFGHIIKRLGAKKGGCSMLTTDHG
jgi:hypothetical protein